VTGWTRLSTQQPSRVSQQNDDDDDAGQDCRAKNDTRLYSRRANVSRQRRRHRHVDSSLSILTPLCRRDSVKPRSHHMNSAELEFLELDSSNWITCVQNEAT